MGEEEKRQLVTFLAISALVVVWVVFFLQLLVLVLVKGTWFQTLARQNGLRRQEIRPPRGEILDVRGRKLATNKIVYCRRDEQNRCHFLSRRQALQLEAEGQLIEEHPWRFYPLRAAAAHLLGYLTALAPGEKIVCNGKTVRGVDLQRGRIGLEAAADCRLRGQPGWRLLAVDPRGVIRQELGRQPAQAGEDLRLTVDGWWQEKIAQLMAGRRGAVVMLKPKTGAVLALYSSPSFDPNKFSLERDDRAIKAWLNDWQNKPLFNRAISGAYHPGSVFKLITASAGLETGKINANTLVEDSGVLKVGKWEYSNWYWTEYGRREGLVNLRKALQRSNDIYFYKVGEWVGVDNLLNWARQFGVGQKTGIDLPAEAAGFLPSPAWKKKTKGSAWFLGNTYHLAIGQGDLTMTPLQVALETAVIANGGYRCRPYVVANRQPSCVHLKLRPTTIQQIRAGMVAACAPHGTAFPFFHFHPVVAGKTGTAEIGDGSGESHAWFTAFAPADNPQIVVTVFIERGGSGAYQAAPIAKAILAAYFHGEQD